VKTIQQITSEVTKNFLKHFGETPLRQRNEDIQKEAIELARFTSMKNLKEKHGDLLASLLMSFQENGWSPEECVEATLNKIESRARQYQAYGRKLSVAILGGAFNPIHEGHIAVAEFLLNFSGVFDEVWITPCYSHMYHKLLAAPKHRLEMCRLATAHDRRIKVFDYEIQHKLGGETYNFVKRLMDEDFAKNKYDFSMVIGMDNANDFDKWVNYQDLERMIRFVVIPRTGVEINHRSLWYTKPPHMLLVPEKPLPEISSSHIRHELNFAKVLKKPCAYMRREVFEYIKKHKLYNFNPKADSMGVIRKG
jgi:nicotinate-nucleotide adenylyltransferase